LTEMSQQKAEELLEMFAEGEGLEAVNTSLALHLTELAKELGRDSLVSRLLDHAAKVAVDAEEQGWCQFELMKHNGSTREEIIELAVASESEGLQALAAGVFHHAALMSLGTDEALTYANRSMRLREEVDDLEGMIYGHALLGHILKEQGDFETSIIHLKKRLDIIPETESLERMEALADLAHVYATLGELETAQNLLIESLDIALRINDLSGILVSKWGLADLAEISDQPDEAMVQLSDIMTKFMEEGEVVPDMVKQRVAKLTEVQ